MKAYKIALRFKKEPKLNDVVVKHRYKRAPDTRRNPGHLHDENLELYVTKEVN